MESEKPGGSTGCGNVTAETHLPSLRALLGELGEVDRLLGVLLPVFLSTRLDKEGIRRRLPLRLVVVFTHHTDGLADRQVQRETGAHTDRQVHNR